MQEVRLEPQDAADGVVLIGRRQASPASGGAGGLGSYIAYSSGMSVVLRDRVSTTGLVGSQVSGVSLPATPAGVAGGTSVGLNYDETRTLAPGNYLDLSMYDRTTLNLSSGTYVFRQFGTIGYDSRFNCDTSAGNITIIVLQSALTFRDRWRLNNSGGGQVSVNAVNGAISLGYDTVVNGAFIAYASTITASDRARVTGHLFASGSIVVGYDAVISTPSWTFTSSGTGTTTHRLYAALLAAGVPGTVTTLTTGDISGTDPPAVAVSLPAVPAPARIVRWYEKAPL
jgi:hypothetical protein